MKKHSNGNVLPLPAKNATFENLIGLGNHSARKNYYPELSNKLEELEAERNRYCWLFDNALHGIFQASMDGVFLEVNPALVKLCGHSSLDDFLQNTPKLNRGFFADDAELTNLINRLLTHGNAITYNTQILHVSGYFIDVSMNVLLKQSGNETLLESFVQDISETINTQRHLEKLNEELELRVRTRTEAIETSNKMLWQVIRQREQIQSELEAAKLLAEEANRNKDKHLATASHDLLQPMNAARLLISTLQERDLQPQNAALVDRIAMALNGAEDLLTDLLDISRLDQNAVQPSFQHFSLAQIFSALQAEFEPVAQQSRLQLRIRPTNLTIYSDPRLFMRIMRNLVSNAIRYTDKGGVIVGTRLARDILTVQVWDSGAGIPNHQKKKIFKEFHQLNTHNKDKHIGAGLGLAIVDRIANVLNHQIDVHSKLGKGSIFSVKVPMIGDPQIRERANPSQMGDDDKPSVNKLDGYSALVIDNDENILASMQALLEQWSMSVNIASNADEALSILQQDNLPDIILSDYHLDTGETGVEVIELIRELCSDDIPVIMITADRSTEVQQLLAEAKIKLLRKPIKPSKLRALMSFMLGDQIDHAQLKTKLNILDTH